MEISNIPMSLTSRPTVAFQLQMSAPVELAWHSLMAVWVNVKIDNDAE